MIRAAQRAAIGLVFLALLGCKQEPLETVATEADSEPESFTVAPDGSLIIGSSTRPVIYRVMKGATAAKKFIDGSGDGNVFFLGMLADAATNTLWACEVWPRPEKRNVSALRGYDLASGAPKFRWDLPGDNNVCNDMTLAPDKSLYVSDTPAARLWRLRPGAAQGELVLEDRQRLTGIDGLTFLDGVLYVNNVISNGIFRVPLDASGKPGALVRIEPDDGITGPDGMRAANGRIFLAQGRKARVSMLTITGDRAKVTTVFDGLDTPTAVEPAGDVLWTNERMNAKVMAVPMPK